MKAMSFETRILVRLVFLTWVDCVSDDGATRLLVDGVRTLDVISVGYMNRYLQICLNSSIFSSFFR